MLREGGRFSHSVRAQGFFSQGFAPVHILCSTLPVCVFLPKHREAFPFTIEASPFPSFFLADLEVLDTCGNASFALSRLLAAAAEGGILMDPAEKVRTSRHSGPT